MTAYDLHMHSSASDGRYTPTQLMRMSATAGLDIVALTDHDTTDGVLEAMMCIEQERLSLTCIPAIELSTLWRQHEIHIVGLWINIEDERWKVFLKQQQDRRRIRIQAIFDRLIALKVLSASSTEMASTCFSRRMIADYLVSQHCITHRQQAFTEWLGKGRPAYVTPKWCGLSEATEMILCAGGLPILAHPLRYGITNLELLELLEAFEASGGLGIEFPLGKTNFAALNYLLNLVQKLTFSISVGSDFHDSTGKRQLQRLPAIPAAYTPIWHLPAWRSAAARCFDCDRIGIRPLPESI